MTPAANKPGLDWRGCSIPGFFRPQTTRRGTYMTAVVRGPHTKPPEVLSATVTFDHVPAPSVPTPHRDT